MKCFLIYFIMTISAFAQNIILPRALLDTIPPFEIGNMWLFDMNYWGNNGSWSYEMTKEIVGIDSANNFVVRVITYNSQINYDTTEYWIWQDSAYSVSASLYGINGYILYKIGLENYFINGGNYTEEYTNITDTIFSIITEGSIFDRYVEYTPSYTFGIRTQFGLKVGLYKFRHNMTGEGGWFSYTHGELAGIKINGIIYGDSTHLITGITDPIEVTSSFELFQNFPNPFNPVTTIRFSIPREGYAKLIIYDCIGRKVQSLADQYFNAGSYQLDFNGEGLPSGIYFYRLEFGKYSLTKQMLLLK